MSIEWNKQGFILLRWYRGFYRPLSIEIEDVFFYLDKQ